MTLTRLRHSLYSLNCEGLMETVPTREMTHPGGGSGTHRDQGSAGRRHPSPRVTERRPGAAVQVLDAPDA